MTKVFYAGDVALLITHFIKGINSWTEGRVMDDSNYLIEALSKDSQIEVTHLPTHLVQSKFPSTFEELSNYDVVFLSDVGTDTLYIYPERTVIPMGKDRLNLIKEYVRRGGGFCMIGGWMSYGGKQGQGKYYGTPIEEILPVKVSPFDDRVESSEGIKPKVVVRNHPVTEGIDWDNAPVLFLGYNRLEMKPEGKLLVECNGDPLVAVATYEKGRTMAFASDCAPHWGAGLVKWEYYSHFWINAAKWLAGSKS